MLAFFVGLVNRVAGHHFRHFNGRYLSILPGHSRLLHSLVELSGPFLLIKDSIGDSYLIYIRTALHAKRCENASPQERFVLILF